MIFKTELSRLGAVTELAKWLDMISDDDYEFRVSVSKHIFCIDLDRITKFETIEDER